MLVIVSEKPSLPTLWVDTAIGIKLAKVQNDEAISDIERRRVLKLKELVVKLARDCKLLCPAGEQEWEYWGERLDGKIAKEFATLSRGIRFLPHQAIQDAQLFIAMEAYLKGATEVRLSSEIYFHHDPVLELKAARKQQFFVSGFGLPPGLLQMSNDAKAGMHQHLEELRRNNVARGRTYEAQFASERRAFAHTMADLARSFHAKLAAGGVTFEDAMAAKGWQSYLRQWHRLTNKPGDWHGLCNFLVSDHFCELPLQKISSQLYAKLVTEDRASESGDSMDVKHLSLAIPLAHFILTDRKMANRIAELRVDKEWGTLVCSESSIDRLFAELEKL